MTELEQIASGAVQRALAGGATDAECTISEGEEFSATIRMREVESLKEAGSRGAGIRVLVGQRAGSSYTSDLSPDGIEKIDRVYSIRAERERQQGSRVFPFTGTLHLRDLRKPASHLIIAQAAGAVLNVGFEVKNRLAVFLMPRTGQAREFLHQSFGLANHHPRKDARPQTLVEFFVSANVPAVVGGARAAGAQ